MLAAVSSIEMAAGIGVMIVYAAVERGADPDALCRAAGFDLKAAQDPDAKISLELEERLWNEAARASGDDALGLHAAQGLKPGAFDVIDYAVRTAPTLRNALDRLVRYNRLVHDAAVFTLKQGDGTLRIEHAFRTNSAVQSRHSAEFTVASVLVVGSQIAGSKLSALEVDFRHARPSSAAANEELERFFGRAPRFAQPMNAVTIPSAHVDDPVPSADPALSRVIERHAEELLAKLPQLTESTTDRVQRLLSRALGDGEATLAAMAKRLRMSERSLQRKLADEDTSFDALLDAMRHDLAQRYLADPKIGIAEVAYLLGYSEPSPFHRAFKRWTGTTPSEARNPR